MVCEKVETVARFIVRCGPERSIDVDSIGMRLALARELFSMRQSGSLKSCGLAS